MAKTTKRKPGRPPGSKNKSNNKTNSKAKGKETAVQTALAETKTVSTDKRVIDEICAVILIALGIFLFAAVEFHAAGQLGNVIGDFLRGVLGFMGIVFPWYLIVLGILIFTRKTAHMSKLSAFLFVLILLFCCIINSARFVESANLVYPLKEFYLSGIKLESGGLFGMLSATFLIKTVGQVGLYTFSIVGIIICILLAFNTPVSRGYDKIRERREKRAAMEEERETEEQLVIENMETESPDERIGFRRRQKDRIKEKNNRENILKYMTDDDTFPEDKRGTEHSYGLESTDDYGKGYGLTGLDGEERKVTYGLTGLDSEEHKVTYGLGLDPEPEPEIQPSGKKRGGRRRKLSGNTLEMDADEVKEIKVNAFKDSYFEDNGQGVIPGVITKEEEPKLTKKEASALTLDPAEMDTQKPIAKYVKPSIDFLNKPVIKNRGNINMELKHKAAKLEETLQNFHVDARVIQVTQGPAVTRYEIQPNVGVKVNSIVRLADDIALNLEAKSIRIEAPIPGKAAVGIEVENDSINMVTLREIVESKAFRSAKSKITFAVGKDIAGNAIVADLKDMPHLLIAGSTGSGKSVCINSIITSILYKADPDEVKLVLIDPKVVELGNYNGIPHLLIPVVTEPTKAAAALNWAVAEMTDRYKKFAESHVRDLKSYNEAMKANGDNDLIMPQIVIIIDELADLMMAAPSQVEESICRLAQMARAAGMHLIVATQRPSVDIITGVIKANIPSRIAFAVSSQFDSRTILDMSGAEKLVGKGDMLFNPLGTGKPVRVQGTFVSDGEVQKVIEFVKAQVQEVEYSNDVLHTIEKGNISSKDDDGDELLADAIECVVTAGQASVSMLQRRFRIGYNRAARIVDMMESRGIIGPQDGSRPRQVLISEEELVAMKEEVEG